VLHDVFVYPDALAAAPGPGPGFLVEVDAREAERLQAHIRRYKLRADFAVRLLDPAEATVWHAWDDTTTAVPPAFASSAGQLHLRDPRAPGLGARLVTLGAARPAVDADPADEAVYRVRRYLHGVAEGQDELPWGRALPLEANADAAGAVDFRKGCYVGQELTVRTRHRGVVRKRVLPCVLYPDDRAPPTRLAYRPDDGHGAVDAAAVPADTSIGRAGRKGRSAGRWLSGVGNIGLALCRLETMTDLALPGEAAGSYSPDDEFVMVGSLGDDSTAYSVKVKAFVPDWLRKALAEQSA